MDEKTKKTADLIVYGKIYTADSKRSLAQAMAVTDGKVIYVGDRAGAERYAGENTQVIEHDKGLVIPGMTEGHAHISSTTEIVYGVSLANKESIDDYVTAIKDYMASHPDEKVVSGSGFENGVFGSLGPTADILDDISTDVPMVMISEDHHSYWVNSKAMELVGIDETTAEVPNGVIVRYPGTSRPTGWFKEMAGNLFSAVLPEMTADNFAHAIECYQDIALSNGVTIAFEPMFDKKQNYDRRFAGYAKLNSEGKLKVTFRVGYTLEPVDDEDYVFAELSKYHEKFRYVPKIQVNTLKIFADGVVEGHTAFLRDDYADAPGDKGEPMLSQERTNAAVKRALDAGYDVHAHAIGDAAIDEVLNAYEYGQTETDRDYRNAITHLQVMVPEHVDRMKSLGVVAVTNPYWHFRNSVYYDTLEKPFLGEERASKEYYMRSITDAGIVTSCASDFPVTVPPRTMDALHLMVNRKQPGHPEMEEMGTGETISVEDGLQVLTYGGAYQNRLEKTKGSLEAGKDADFVLLDSDVLTILKEDIYKTQVTATYIGGEKVWSLGTEVPDPA